MFMTPFLLSILVSSSFLVKVRAQADGSSDSRTAQSLYKYLRELSKHNDFYLFASEALKTYVNAPDSDPVKKYDSLHEALTYLEEITNPIQFDNVNLIEQRILGIQNNLYLSVPKELNFMWIGKLGIAQKEYLEVWKNTVEGTDYDIVLWKDSNAYLANYLKQNLIKKVNEIVEKKAAMKATRMRKRNKKYIPKTLKKKQMRIINALRDKISKEIRESMTKTRNPLTYDEAVAKVMNKYKLSTPKQTEKMLKEYKKSWRSLEAKGYQIKEIGSLWTENDKMKTFYDQELSLRQNLPSATDIARVRVLKNFGGIYYDMDLLPPLNLEKLTDLTDNRDIFPSTIERRPGSEADTELDIKMYVTKVLMDEKFSSKKRYKGTVLKAIEQDHPTIRWELLKEHLLSEVADHFYDWFTPPREIVVPPGAEAGMRMYHELDGKVKYSNQFLCAARSEGRGNPGMERIETEIEKAYQNLESGKFVETIHGVWPLWPVNPNDLKKSDVYRMDGIVPGAKGTIDVTGPGIVKAALQNIIDDRGIETNEQFDRTLHDHGFDGEYFNSETEEEERSTWLTPDEPGDPAKMDVGEPFNLVLQVGDGEAVDFAGRAIFARSIDKGEIISDNGQSSFRKWDSDAQTFRLGDDFKRMTEVRGDSVKIAIVGHGDGEGGITGIEPKVLANNIMQLVEQGRTLEEVNFHVCQMKSTDDNGELKNGFLKDFLDELPKEIITENTRFIVRNTLFEVGLFGEKWYAEPRSKLSQLIARMRGESHIYYKWTRNPKGKNIKSIITRSIENDKWLAHGEEVSHDSCVTLDIASDRSGPLHTSMNDINTPVSKRSSVPTEGEYRGFSLDPSVYNSPEEGIIITEPGPPAIFNALRDSDHKVTVVGSSPRRLEGTRNCLSILSRSLNLKDGLAQIKLHYPQFGKFVERILKKAINDGLQLSHSMLKRRVQGQNIDFVSMDMTGPAASKYLVNVVARKAKVAALFLADHLTPDNLSPSSFLKSSRIQLHSLMNNLANFMKYGGGSLKLRGLSNVHTTITTPSELIKYKETSDIIAFGDHLFKELEARKMVEDFTISMNKLRESQNIGENFIIILESVEPKADNTKMFSMQLVDHEHPAIVKHIITDDNTFYKVKRKFDEEFKNVEPPEIMHEELEGDTKALYETEPVNTLGVGMFVLALTHTIREYQESNKKNLTLVGKTMKIHMWVNLVGGGVTAAADIGHVIQLVQAGIREGSMAAMQTSAILTKTLRALGNVGKGVGVVLGVVNVGFDIFELATAHTNGQKTAIGIQLGFDSTFVAMSAAAYYVGAETALGMTFGYFTVPIMGLAFGVTALQGNFNKIANDAAKVGKYFGSLDEGFQQAYHYKEGRFEPNAVSVITELNIKRKIVRLGSPFLEKTKHWQSRPGSAKLNFYFAHDDTQIDPEHFIDVRKRLKYPEVQREAFAVHAGKPSVVVLPIAPNSTIHYNWNLLSGATTRQDYGFSVLRTLEECGDFDFDFYQALAFSEYIINKMEHTYMPTTVRVFMDYHARTLVVPKHSLATMDMVTYRIEGSSGLTTIILQEGVHLILDEDEGSRSVPWVLDGSLMAAQTSSIRTSASPKTVHVGGVPVNYGYLTSPKSTIYIHTMTNILLFDIQTGDFAVKESFGSTFTSEALRERLNKLTKEHHVGERFLRIRNFNRPQNNEHVLQAFYDTKSQQFFFTNQRTSKVIPGDTQIVGVDENVSWFTSTALGRVWSCDRRNYEVLLEVQLYDPTQVSSVQMSVQKRKKHLLIEVIYASESLTGRCRYIVMNGKAVVVSIEMHTKYPELYSVTRLRISETLQSLSKVTAKSKFLSLGYSRFYFATAANWIDCKVITINEDTKADTLVHRFWVNGNAGLSVNPRYADDQEILTAVFLPSKDDGSKISLNLLVYFPSTGFLWQYISRTKHTGKLSAVQRNVSNILHSTNGLNVVKFPGVILTILENGKSKVLGYTTDAIKSIQTSKELKKSMTSEHILKFYSFHDGHLKSSGIWYFPPIKSYSFVNLSFDGGEFTLMQAFKDCTGALLRTQNGSLWLVPVIKDYDVGTIWNVTKFLSKYRIAKPQLWKAWDQSEPVVSSRDANGEVILETVSGILFSIKESGFSFSFHLHGLRFNKTDISDDDVSKKMNIIRQLKINLPLEDYLAVWSNSSKGWFINLKQESYNLEYVDIKESHGIPLGVNKNDRLIFFNKSSHIMWEGSRVLSKKMYLSVTRFGDLLSLESFEEADEVDVPDLKGVSQVALALKSQTDQMTVPASTKKIALDTLELDDSTMIEIYVHWDMSHSQHFKVGEQVILQSRNNDVIYWNGKKHQALSIKDMHRLTMTLSWEDRKLVRKIVE